MSNADQRRQKKSGRQIRVFSDLNRELRPEDLARIIVAAGLKQARLEAAEGRVKTLSSDEEFDDEA